MEQILRAMQGRLLPSVTGRVHYTIMSVEAGRSVTLEGGRRSSPSILAWRDIRTVYDAARAGGDITPTVVDEILDNPNNRDSSTMCALVLAMLDTVHRP
jgi:hypothetical protein